MRWVPQAQTWLFLANYVSEQADIWKPGTKGKRACRGATDASKCHFSLASRRPAICQLCQSAYTGSQA